MKLIKLRDHLDELIYIDVEQIEAIGTASACLCFKSGNQIFIRESDVQAVFEAWTGITMHVTKSGAAESGAAE